MDELGRNTFNPFKFFKVINQRANINNEQQKS